MAVTTAVAVPADPAYNMQSFLRVSEFRHQLIQSRRRNPVSTTLRAALWKRQPQQRMWGISGHVVLGVEFERGLREALVQLIRLALRPDHGSGLALGGKMPMQGRFQVFHWRLGSEHKSSSLVSSVIVTVVTSSASATGSRPGPASNPFALLWAFSRIFPSAVHAPHCIDKISAPVPGRPSDSDYPIPEAHHSPGRSTGGSGRQRTYKPVDHHYPSLGLPGQPEKPRQLLAARSCSVLALGSCSLG
jgi:hypothetical protein